jgi:hypothetical protein
VLVRWDTGSPEEDRFFPPLLRKGLRRKETALHITGFVLPGVGVSTVRLQVLETVGQSRPRTSSTRALKSSYPTALVTASIRLKATESWCRSNSGVLNTRNTQPLCLAGPGELAPARHRWRTRTRRS